MRDPKRLDKFFDEFKEIYKKEFPDWRFFQLMSNFMGWVYQEQKKDPWFVEENQCIELFKKFSEEMSPY